MACYSLYHQGTSLKDFHVSSESSQQKGPRVGCSGIVEMVLNSIGEKKLKAS
jgi:hypothetical protein